MDREPLTVELAYIGVLLIAIFVGNTVGVFLTETVPDDLFRLLLVLLASTAVALPGVFLVGRWSRRK